MNTKQHIRTGATALALFFCCGYALAGSFTAGNLTYSYTDGKTTAEVTGVVDKTVTSLEVPATVENGGVTYTVTAYSCNAFTVSSDNQNTTLQTVTLGDNITSISEGAFMYCTALATVTLPAGLKTIPARCFNMDSKLSSINWPTGLTTIGAYAFNSCGSLTGDWQMPNTVTSLGESALNGVGFTSVTVSTGLTSLPGSCFAGSGKLKKIVIPDNVKSLGTYCLSRCTSLTDVTLPAGLTELSNDLFKGCTSLTTLTIPGTVTKVGNSVFSGCTALTSVSFPDGVSSMGSIVFSGCKSLTDFKWPTKVTAIPELTFYNNTSLTSYDVPEGITAIGNSAFSGCSKLAKVTLPSTLLSIGEYSFANCGFSTILIPKGVTTITPGAFKECMKVEAFEVEAGSRNFKSDKGVLFNIDETRLMCFPPARDPYKYHESYYVVPSTVTALGYYSCQGFPYRHITLPSGLKEIGEGAFMSSTTGKYGGLESITIPASVTKIKQSAFYNALYKKEVYMLGTTPPSIEGGSFSNQLFDSGTTIYVKPSAVSNYKNATGWKNAQIKTDIPLAQTKEFGTLCPDFDVEIPEGSDIEALVATAYDKSTRQLTLTKLDGNYIPSRQGEKHDQYVGVVLHKTGDRNLYYRIGEKDYTTGDSQKTYTGTNYLVGVTVPTWIYATETIGGTDYTNFGLTNGEFRRYDADGILQRNAWSKAYLHLPTSWRDASAGAKSILLFISGGTTGIRSLTTAAHDEDAYYTLSGVRVEQPVKGICIHDGKKVLVK